MDTVEVLSNTMMILRYVSQNIFISLLIVTSFAKRNGTASTNISLGGLLYLTTQCCFLCTLLALNQTTLALVILTTTKHSAESQISNLTSRIHLLNGATVTFDSRVKPKEKFLEDIIRKDKRRQLTPMQFRIKDTFMTLVCYKKAGRIYCI